MRRRQRCKAVNKDGTRCKRAWGHCSTPLCLQHHRMSCYEGKIVKRFTRKLWVKFKGKMR
jgi:hypothetical protein